MYSWPDIKAPITILAILTILAIYHVLLGAKVPPVFSVVETPLIPTQPETPQ